MSNLHNPAEASKSALRNAALAARDALGRAQREAAAQAVAARGLPFGVAHGTIVAGYAAIRSEFDPLPLMRKLAAQGATLALPAVIAADRPLQFRAWTFGEALRRGPLGIAEPLPEASALAPDDMLVPHT